MFRSLSAWMIALLWVTTAGAAEPVERRWVYLQMNLQVAENLDKAQGILERAAKAGYNGVVLADYKLNVLDRVPDHYFRHARQFQELADKLHLEVIPTVAPMGYSDGLLAHNPNLAEGIPVADAPFVVQDGVAQLASDVKNPLPGGSFENAENNQVAGWDFQDSAGESSFVDTRIKHAGKSSLRWDNPGKLAKESNGNARVSKKVPVSPWRQFHASVWIKTKGYESANSVRLFAMGAGGRVLSHSNLGVKRDQDWTQHHIVFNSLDNNVIRIYCGTWGGTGGTLWMDDLQLEETAFVNLVRRPKCPLVVTDGQGTTFEAGRDFADLQDEKLGQVPYAGSFEVWHAPPQLKVLPGSRIRNGQKLQVSFYHTVTIYDNQVTCCLGDDLVFDVLQDQVQRVEDLFHPQTYFLSHDEIRVANWCPACQKPGQSAGQLVATNFRRCVETIRKINPESKLCVWSDMFDPHHNAHKDFYLVNGDLAGSWEGLGKEVTVVNWNEGQAGKSLPFFSQRGNPQVLAGFYDNNPRSIKTWLGTQGGLPGVNGAMYTTWQQDFSQLETFAQAAWGGAKPAGK